MKRDGMSELSVNLKALTDNSDIHLNYFNPRLHLVHEPVHCPEAVRIAVTHHFHANVADPNIGILLHIGDDVFGRPTEGVPGVGHGAAGEVQPAPKG